MVNSYIKTCGIFFGCDAFGCFQEYTNECHACSNTAVKYYFYGSCDVLKGEKNTKQYSTE